MTEVPCRHLSLLNVRQLNGHPGILLVFFGAMSIPEIVEIDIKFLQLLHALDVLQGFLLVGGITSLRRKVMNSGILTLRQIGTRHH